MSTSHSSFQHQFCAALFDLDGVIAFTDKYHAAAWERLCVEEGWCFNEAVADQCRGIPRMASLEVILRHNGLSPFESEKMEALADRKNRYYVEMLQSINTADLYPGVLDFLELLQSRGIPVALCSSSKNAAMVLEKLALSRYFKAVVSGADIVHAKPHPEIFQLGASRLGVDPRDCLVFEDAPAGVESALAAGAQCIGVGAAEFLTQARRTIRRYDELEVDALFATDPVTAAWVLRDKGYDSAQAVHHGNKYLIGNGSIGCRGTLEEYGADQLAGLQIAGLYDKHGDAWREPVNAPNPFYTRIAVADQPLQLPTQAPLYHEQSLDLRCGLHSRRTVFATSSGTRVTVNCRRFVSMDDSHLLVMEYEVRSNAACRLRIETGIDEKVWDINGPHLAAGRSTGDDGIVCFSTTTLELGCPLAVAETVEWDGPARMESIHGTLRTFQVDAAANETIRFCKYAVVFTGRDGVDDVATAAVSACRKARAGGFDSLITAHRSQWNRLWAEADVIISGDPKAQFALRYSLYHLLSIAPRHDERVSIPARGLSGQVYKGAVFWDTEMFMVPFFLNALPQVARNLLRYRFHTLDGARRKAKEYGFEGAFYAWESQESGDDACSLFNVTDVFTGRPMRTYFRDKQVHISAAVAHAIATYIEQTGDEAFLVDGGAEVIFECARFYRSYLYFKRGRDRYEMLDVTGPDEYHERVHNNAYTNRMVRRTFEVALQVHERMAQSQASFLQNLVKRLELQETLVELPALIQKLYVPKPDATSGVIEQFDGYHQLEEVTLETLKSRRLNPTEYFGGGNGLATSTQVLKQADVVLMLSLFGRDYSREVLAANWDYYEPRTEHGSSLSACAYARVAARIGRADLAYAYFLNSATIDLTGKSKQYIGPLYIGGTHPAANGGAWMVAVQGFGGLEFSTDGPSLTPRLPSGWTALRFRTHWRECGFTVFVSSDEIEIAADSSNPRPISWMVYGEKIDIAPGHKRKIDRE